MAYAKKLGEKYGVKVPGTGAPPKNQPKAKPSECFHSPDLSVNGCLLSRAELEFFRQNGFLVKKSLLDPAKLARVMELIWDEIHAIEPCVVTRSDPKTWIDPQWSRSATPKEGFYEGRPPVFRLTGKSAMKLHRFGAAPAVVDLLPNDEKVQAISKMVLSPSLKPVKCTRGMYSMFPTSTGNTTLGPHCDKKGSQLSLCAYLEEVPERGGGFTVFPGSHRFIYPAHEMDRNHSPKQGVFDAAVAHCLETITPFEICGGAGDVIFWHSRLLHSAGIHTGTNIRFAVFADIQEMADEGLDGFLGPEEEKAADQYFWFVDGQLYRNDREPAPNDMFRHWTMRSDEKSQPS